MKLYIDAFNDLEFGDSEYFTREIKKLTETSNISKTNPGGSLGNFWKLSQMLGGELLKQIVVGQRVNKKHR